MNIGSYEIDNGRTFVIAEIGNNHNGSLDRALAMVDEAKLAGADCVKFQMRHIESVYRERTLNNQGDDLGTEYVIDLLRRFELKPNEHQQVANYCRQNNILYMCTPWDKSSVDVLETFGVPAYKVASADLTNLPLIRYLVETNKPLILSTGMSRTDEIRETVRVLNEFDSEFVLLHCNSTYPAPYRDINLRWMSELKTIHKCIGYSGHERGINVSMAAVSLGACIVERHVSFDRSMEGPDHSASLTFSEFSKMIEGIRQIEEAMGSDGERHLSQGEMINRENLGKSLVAANPLSKGTILEERHIKVRSPGQGLSPQKYKKLLGKKIRRDMKTEDFFFDSDLDNSRIEPYQYVFSRPWGIPVRYHDYEEFSKSIIPDFWEFHLSYSDMDLNISDYLSGQYDVDFVVHAPELFSESHLMNLASQDNKYRQESISQTQRVIDITRDLNTYFPKTAKPLIVANIGGFTMDAPLKEAERDVYYETFALSLKQLDMGGIEIIPQTMAPFPWHFGGQRFQNLFLHKEEIVNWCEILGLRMCFDVSHSKLACHQFGVDFESFCQEIAPYTAHIHLGDAKGVNGEGLQIGEGNIDFQVLAKHLREGAPEASFIPEIWQGHKNQGEGFWIALKLLEKMI